jgi:hypothetical protein
MKMVGKSTQAHTLISQFRGAYHRVATRLGVHPSYVSRVARGERHSEQISAALKREIRRLLIERGSEPDGRELLHPHEPQSECVSPT